MEAADGQVAVARVGCMGHCGGQVDTVFICGGGGIPLHSCILPSAPWKADPSDELFKPECLFSSAVLMLTAQGYPSCAEVCRGVQIPLVLHSRELLAMSAASLSLSSTSRTLTVLPSGPRSVFHPFDPPGWHKDKQ